MERGAGRLERQIVEEPPGTLDARGGPGQPAGPALPGAEVDHGGDGALTGREIGGAAPGPETHHLAGGPKQHGIAFEQRPLLALRADALLAGPSGRAGLVED